MHGLSIFLKFSYLYHVWFQTSVKVLCSLTCVMRMYVCAYCSLLKPQLYINITFSIRFSTLLEKTIERGLRNCRLLTDTPCNMACNTTVSGTMCEGWFAMMPCYNVSLKEITCLICIQLFAAFRNCIYPIAKAIEEPFPAYL